MIVVYIVAFFSLGIALLIGLTAPQFLPFVLGLMLGGVLSSIEDQIIIDTQKEKDAENKK